MEANTLEAIAEKALKEHQLAQHLRGQDSQLTAEDVARQLRQVMQPTRR